VERTLSRKQDSSVSSVPSVVTSACLKQAESPADVSRARELFLEYAKSLNFSLCFQSFDKELAELPGDYAPPDGRLLLLEQSGNLAGCVGLHKLDADACEMKRLYLRSEFRGRGLGLVLAKAIIDEARQIGYRRMRLDTVEPVMKDAVAMYQKMGFKQIAPYRPNPIDGAMYMELEL